MKELLQEIGTAEVKDILQLDNLCHIVKDYYANNKRHKYSEISVYLMETDDIEYLLENLRKIQDRLREHPEDESVSIKVFKLIDHITLELNRTKYNSKNFRDMQIASMNEALNSASKEIRKVTDEFRAEQAKKMNLEIEDFRNETEDLKRKVDDSYSQFVSILGIFSAVVLVFFGGLTAFNSIFANMQHIGRFKLSFTIALVGIIIFNLVFMFLYVLAKLLKREIIASTGSEVTDKNILIKWIKRIWKRYPYIVMFNTIMFVIIVASFIAWYGLTYYNWKI